MYVEKNSSNRLKLSSVKSAKIKLKRKGNFKKENDSIWNDESIGHFDCTFFGDDLDLLNSLDFKCSFNNSFFESQRVII